jgi:hypothetical protein
LLDTDLSDSDKEEKEEAVEVAPNSWNLGKVALF